MRHGSFPFTLAQTASRRSLTLRRLFPCRTAQDKRIITGKQARRRPPPARGAGRRTAQSEAPPYGLKNPAPRYAPSVPPENRGQKAEQESISRAAGNHGQPPGRGRVRRRRSKSRRDARTKIRQGRKLKGWSGALSGAGIRLRPPRAGTAAGKDRGKPSVPVTSGPGTTPRLSSPQQAGNEACLFPELRKPARHRNTRTETRAGRRPRNTTGA